MSLKSWNWNSALFLLFSLGGQAVFGSEVLYFDRGIDYWNISHPDPKTESAELNGTSPSPVTHQPSTPLDAETGDKAKGGSYSGGAFPWHQFLDPKNKEFFKEGDYTPPEPFMEIVRDPSDSNLQMWFAYISKKNELSSRLEARMQEYLAKNSIAVPPEEKVRVASHLEKSTNAAPDSKRFRFRLYFDSNCPHCKRMLGTMADLQARGYLVEALQVDRDTRSLSNIPIAVLPAQPSDLKEKDIQSVPVLLVGDLSKKVVYRINGYQSTAQVLAALPKEEEK